MVAKLFDAGVMLCLVHVVLHFGNPTGCKNKYLFITIKGDFSPASNTAWAVLWPGEAGGASSAFPAWWLHLPCNSCSPAAGNPAEASAKSLKGQNCGMSVSIATSQWATFSEQFSSSGRVVWTVSSADGYVAWRRVGLARSWVCCVSL